MAVTPRTAHELNDLHRRLGEQRRQGTASINFREEYPHVFVATADWHVEWSDRSVPKDHADHELWNRLTGEGDPRPADGESR